MKLVLCPRCELNYITGSEEYCKVCMQEMRGVRRPDDVELCSICNENPVLPGRDVCAACLREMDVGGNSAEHGDHEERAEAEEIVEMEGFGEKSFENLIAACDKASHTTPDRLLNSLGILGIGAANAQMICRAAGNQWEKISQMTEEQLLSIDGIGDVLAGDFTAFFADEDNRRMLGELLPLLTLDEHFEERTDQPLQGKTFVITGSLETFENRDAAKAKIQELGGKVAGSVSKKTDYLVNNDIGSGSSKNKKAKELGIPIITEDELLEMIEQ